ncbi:unnamed protein product, partial [Adineta steineri]
MSPLNVMKPTIACDPCSENSLLFESKMSSPGTSTASVDSDAIEAVKYNTILFVEVWSFVIFFLGTVGHIL